MISLALLIVVISLPIAEILFQLTIVRPERERWRNFDLDAFLESERVWRDIERMSRFYPWEAVPTAWKRDLERIV